MVQSTLSAEKGGKIVKKPVFSCMLDGVYKEFVIEHKKEYTKRELEYLKKYLIYVPKEKMAESVAEALIATKMKNKDYILLEELLTDDEVYNTYVRDILSRMTLRETFSLPANMVDGYCHSMVQSAIPHMSNNKKLREDVERNLSYCEDGIKNSIEMKNHYLELVGGKDGEYHFHPTKYFMYVEASELEKEEQPQQKQKVS